MLGSLLRANTFERWLCSEALDSLVLEASATLMELSGDQYQLDRDDRNDLVVIDYNDAGTRRPVHTLSGGETFQASLALALALSHQVIALSAGMRDLNSMFLDEGFGTLDEDTLDTVATTLERLAADSGRMVGIVTHVAALADRVPVRFVVSRDGGIVGAAQGAGMSAPAALARGLFTVDPWDPSYGLAFGDELERRRAPRFERTSWIWTWSCPPERWRPVGPDPTASLPGVVLFLDGVRRIDARIWVHGDSPQPAPGIAASFAAGLVCCDGEARIAEVTVHGPFSPRLPGLPASPPGTAATRRGRRRKRPRSAVPGAAAGAHGNRGRTRDEVPCTVAGRRRSAHRRRSASRPHPPGAHGRLHQDPPRVLPACGTGRRRCLTRTRAAHPGVRHGNLLAPQRLVSAAAQWSWRGWPGRALVWCGAARMLRGPASHEGHAARRPDRPAPPAACQHAAQGSPRSAEPRPHRRPRTRTPAQARRPATALPCSPRRRCCLIHAPRTRLHGGGAPLPGVRIDIAVDPIVTWPGGLDRSGEPVGTGIGGLLSRGPAG